MLILCRLRLRPFFSLRARLLADGPDVVLGGRVDLRLDDRRPVVNERDICKVLAVQRVVLTQFDYTG